MSTYYTCDEIAAMYKVKVLTVWDWIRQKKLPALKIGKEYRVTNKDIEMFEESRRTIKVPNN